ncbi:unnamed protein product [Prorocentrum cordatum]|uniref:Uncharacterized protein n=1 Tax=Prorocentrum cordatum TaxID=2364126 RepID=A0ABN9W1K8_9DINO|nr:unnamed protein product [Polarella glacialis]
MKSRRMPEGGLQASREGPRVGAPAGAERRRDEGAEGPELRGATLSGLARAIAAFCQENSMSCLLAAQPAQGNAAERLVAPAGAQTCLQAALRGASEAERIVRSFFARRAGPRGAAVPCFLAGAEQRFARLWDLPSFRCLFSPGLGAHLSDKPASTIVSLKDCLGNVGDHAFFNFPIVGGPDLATPAKDWKLKDFAGGHVIVNQGTPQGFVHGLNYPMGTAADSSLLPLLIGGARLASSSRTKAGLAGAWVAKEGDFATCDAYAGPEVAMVDDDGPLWVQAFVVGRTWDLKTPARHKTYRCIRTQEGHVCTHALLRVWPDGSSENLGDRLGAYHYRPPGGLPDTDTEQFAGSMRSSLVARFSGAA